jgi:hypothetical protein
MIVPFEEIGTPLGVYSMIYKQQDRKASGCELRLEEVIFVVVLLPCQNFKERFYTSINVNTICAS